MRLMERSRNGLTVTPEGSAMLPLAQAIVCAHRRAAQEAASIRGIDSGHVKVAAFSSVATHWLPAAVGTLLETHPKITYELMLRVFLIWAAFGHHEREGHEHAVCDRGPSIRSKEPVAPAGHLRS